MVYELERVCYGFLCSMSATYDGALLLFYNIYLMFMIQKCRLRTIFCLQNGVIIKDHENGNDDSL